MPDIKNIAARMNAAEWIAEERRGHADVKYGEGTDAKKMVDEQFANQPFGEGPLDFILSYLKRAEMFGLDSMQGRQALGKAAVTCIAYLERAIELHGPMPKPGVPSGEIQEWTR